MLTLLIVLGSIALVLALIYFIEPFIYALLFSWFISLFVRNPPFIDDIAAEFPGRQLLKDNWQAIRKELDSELAEVESIPKFHEVDKLQAVISDQDKVAWRTFIIKGFGKFVDANCAKAPVTAGLIRQLPQVSTAMFSIIDAGKHIPPHYGFFKSVLRYHLALVIPSGEVYIEVGGQKYAWKEGEDVLFDDTYRHEVWNKTSGRRVVLFLDIMREKGFPGPFKAVNRWMFGMLTGSPKLREAARRAEVARNV